MDKKSKMHRRKTDTKEELTDTGPHGASFDTEEGRAAQGMRRDIRGGAGEVEGESSDALGKDEEDEDEEKRAPEGEE